MKTASETILVDYTTLPPLVVTQAAFARGHHRVAWTSLMAVLQRALPIMTAASTTVIPENDESSTLYASKPLFICITAYLSLYCIFIPLEAFGWNSFSSYGNRHLPRNYSSIADLISWCYASKILRSHDSGYLDVDMRAKNKTEEEYVKAQLITKLDGDDVMQYAFGLYSSSQHEGVKCIGFDVASNVNKVELRRRISKDVEASKKKVRMYAPDDLEHVLGGKKERSAAPERMGPTPYSENQNEEEQ